MPEGRPLGSAAGHPSALPKKGMVVYDRDQAGSIKSATAPPADGGQTRNDLVPGHVRTGSRRRLGRVQGTDVTVA